MQIGNIISDSEILLLRDENFLKSYKVKNVNHLTIASLNINSIRYKFDQLKIIIQDYIDILIIQETKLDSTFPKGQFHIDGYLPPFRRDRNADGGGLLVYIKDNIPAKVLPDNDLANDIEGIFIELSFKNDKWILFGTYHPPGQCPTHYFSEVGRVLDKYLVSHSKYVLVGDFNRDINDKHMHDFILNYGLDNIVKDKTCFKSIDNPSCIDLLLTNKPRSFQHTTTFDTGLSDFHKMVISSFKCTFEKRNPKEVVYRDYKNFDNNIFRNDLNRVIEDSQDWAAYEKNILSVLDRHAPVKRKTIRANHKPYITKQIRKAIMTRTRFANKRHKTNSQEDIRLFKKQQNYVNRECKRAKKEYFNSLDIKCLQDNKKFWSTIKNEFSDKVQGNNKITLVKGNDIISDDAKVAEEFSDLFSNAVKNLNIQQLPTNVLGDDSYDVVDSAVYKYNNHPSILKIMDKFPVISERFKFQLVSESYVFDVMKKIKSGKATRFKHIPCKILKQNADLLHKKTTELINNTFCNHTFSDVLKLADVHPVHKKGVRVNAENYRPVSVLSPPSKVVEKAMHDQISTKMDGILSSKLCGYRKGFASQHALISMIEQWRKSLDQNGFAGAVLMDLSKTFDCMNHELLLAKLYAYGFGKNSIKTINSYLKNRWQRVKVNDSFSQWTELLLGVPQGSVLGPLLFNIYLNDLIWFIDNGEVCNYADDTTPYSCGNDLDVLKSNLETDCLNAINWFKDNYMRLNTSKCKLLVGGRKDHTLNINVGDSNIEESKEVDLLGVLINGDLSFSGYLNKQIKQANSKIASIKRYQYLLSFHKKKVLLSSFVHCHFSYAPLAWMFHSRDINNKINRIQERALRILYNDEEGVLEQLLRRDKGFTVHERNIQKLLIEMFKAKNKMEPNLLQGIFETSNYQGPKLRTSKYFLRPHVKTVHYGGKSLQNLGVRLWNQLPCNIQETDTLSKFKEFVKNWRPQKCPCDLCKSYIHGVGYVNILESNTS